jgi:hypothetical protein
MITKDNFAAILLVAVPEFQDIYESHLAENEEVLGHPLFGELFDFMAAHADDEKLFRRIIGFINYASANSDSHVKGMVQVSFLEHIAFSELADRIKPLLNDVALQRLNAVTDGTPNEDAA